MNNTPSGMRLHIAILGRRNVGKSSIMNALVGQEVSVVADYPGTTTDPVNKPMELLPYGPIVFIDTAGLDDVGKVGELRVKKTYEVLDRTDVALLITDNAWTEYEEKITQLLKSKKIPYVVVFNKCDIFQIPAELVKKIKLTKVPVVLTSAINREGIEELKEAIIKVAPEKTPTSRALVSDLIMAGEWAILVVPIDLEAPKGRLILPQQQVIRDILDNDGYCTIVKERELLSVIRLLNQKPKLVICDSQVVLKVSADVPNDIMMTTFSILFARFKGDLEEFVRGVKAVENLKDGSKVLIAEACTHHSIADDIGRVKIPRWLRQYTGANLIIDVKSGYDFPEDLSSYDLVVHCGGCMLNRTMVLNRIRYAKSRKVPITNYGVIISYLHGVLHRTLEPFPYAKAILEE